MVNKIKAPYGSWKSLITTDLITSEEITLEYIELDGDDIYWLERRPKEGGRSVIARHTPDGRTDFITPLEYNVRTQVHEYGGGAFTVHQGTVYFVNYEDQCIYRQPRREKPHLLTPESKRRYADLHVDPKRGLLYCVVEDHSPIGREAENYLAAIDLNTGEIALVLERGNDFYASIALSPDLDQIAWLTWNHPNMPWDGCELWLAELKEDGRTSNQQQIAGDSQESIFQPQWSPAGNLFFISDRTGWWNLYQWKPDNIKLVIDMQAEFARPQWIFRRSTYAFASENTAYCAYTQNGFWYLGLVDIEGGKLTSVEVDWTDMEDLRANQDHLVLWGGSPKKFPGIHQYDLSKNRWKILQTASKMEIDPGYLSQPEPIEFPTANGLSSFGLLYPPTNKDFDGLENEKPPLLVFTHGGPTSAANSYLFLRLQFWTSRGFAVLDVNYGGSTGFGREYRTRLNGQWGVVDLQDCENGARYLVDQGIVDGERLIIRGGSAGGYTTMCAVTFGSTFKVGGCLFGLGELEIFVHDTHKFESHYMHTLVGPYPQARDLYITRSPIHHPHLISCPVIFFQGLDDKIVPPNQSEMMFEAARSKELPTAYIAFEGEGHGFRKAESIKRTLDAEQYFYSRVLGFDIADEVEPIEIENL